MRSSMFLGKGLAAAGIALFARATLAGGLGADQHEPRDIQGLETRSNVSDHDLQYYNKKTAPFYVTPTDIPNVPFDVGESYAGLIPVNASDKSSDAQKMFFWFFPTVNPAGKDDLIIWLNGGPGCSSMEGFLQENGPFSWKPGTYSPTPNAWSWHKLANIIWIEYPIGTGFSSGKVTASDDAEAAAQFLSFWRNFIEKFGLKGKKIYVTGESYSGVHVPYVGSAMLDDGDKDYFDVQGALYYDPVMPYSDDLEFDHAAFPAFFRHWENVFSISDKEKKVLESDNKKCELDKYLDTHLTYPPPKRPWKAAKVKGCDILSHFDDAIAIVNPCFNSYHILDTCPVLFDPLGYPSIVYTPPGATIWFNWPDVRRAIHVPVDYHTWAECQDPVYTGDGSGNYNSTQHEEKFQTLVETTGNVLIGSGLADIVIQPNATALAIQVVKWNGKQGFQKAPSQDLLLPEIDNNDNNTENWFGGGVQGTVHTERGLTHSTVKTSGHMVPQYASPVAFRHLEFILGRVKSLSDGAAFTVNISTSFAWPY